MKKSVIIILLLILIVSSSSFSISADDRKVREIDSGWFTVTFGAEITILPSYPSEGNGIIYENKEFIETNYPNSVIFDIDLIAIPKIGGILFDLGEFNIKEEKIVAVNFSMEHICKKADCSNVTYVTFFLFSPEEKLVTSQNLCLNYSFTKLKEPVILNKSGLWKMRLEFITKENDTNIQIWEKVPEKYTEKGKAYLTFNINTSKNLSFQNYYERTLPIFSLSEVIGFQQMLLFQQQGKYLSDTAKSLDSTASFLSDTADSVEDIAQGQNKALIVGVIMGFILTLASVSLTHLLSKKRYKKD
jgi:hypothetical protein